MRRRLLLILWVWALGFGSSPVLPATAEERVLLCWKALTSLETRLELPSFRAYPHRTGRYRLGEKILSRVQSGLDPAETRRFLDWYYDHFFSDVENILLDNSRSASDRLHRSVRYDRWGQRPFAGYRKARDFLFQHRLEDLTLEHFAQAQKLLLEGENGWFFTNSEMTPASYLGQIRDERVRYAGWGQKLDLSKEIRRLTTHELVNDPTQTVEDVIRANPHLGHAGIFLWEYAPLSQWRKYSDRLTPETRTALENAEREWGAGRLDTNSARARELRRKVITEIFNNRWRQFLDEAKQARSREEIVEAIGRLHHELVSVHPFVNGNGRFTRLLTERLLEEFNLPPPVWSHFGEDVILSQKDFVALLKDSIAVSRRFHEELDLVIREGVSYEAISSPILAGRVQQLIPEEMRKEINPEEFMVWVTSAQTSLDPYGDIPLPFLGRSRKGQSFAGISQALREFKEWRDKHSYARHREEGIRFLTPLFTHTFGRLSRSPKVYEMKLEQYYTDRPVYRGAPLDRVPSDRDIVKHFAVSRPILQAGRRDADVEHEFRNFNVTLARAPERLSRLVHRHMQGHENDSPFVGFHLDRAGAMADKRGALLEESHKRDIRATLEVEGYARKVGAINTNSQTQFLKFSYDVRKHLMAGGMDPEAVRRVVVEDVDPQRMTKNPILLPTGRPNLGPAGVPLSGYGVLRRRVAERVGHNRVRLTEMAGNNRVLKESLWEIRTDGSVEKLSEGPRGSSEVK